MEGEAVSGYSRAHTTHDECDFLEGLGSHWLPNGRPRGSRRELLMVYIEASEHRWDWGQMDRRAVMEYAVKLLDECRAG